MRQTPLPSRSFFQVSVGLLLPALTVNAPSGEDLGPHWIQNSFHTLVHLSS